MPWLDNFLDLAGPRFDGWQEASRDYARPGWNVQAVSHVDPMWSSHNVVDVVDLLHARRFTGSSNPTRVKLRWDENFLYVAAELRSRWDLPG